LVGDLTRILMRYENVDKVPTVEIECSGCEGSVRLKYAKEKGVPAVFSKWLPATNMEIATHLLRNFSIFKSLDENQLREIIPFLKFQKYPQGSIIIKRGDPAQHLFIILSGVVEVLDENSNPLSRLQKGDVFGEMGLISGDFVGATIKVSEPAAIALIKGEDFRFVLGKHASVQTYLTRLLAKRLADSNVSRAGEIASVMSGNLSELSLAEVLQSLHLAQKSGCLTLSLSKGNAELFLSDGDLIKATYADRQGEEAIVEALREKRGRFRFNPALPADARNAPAIGGLMKILLDTTRILDEENIEN
jgi:CRP-like cAMP-binding protein